MGWNGGEIKADSIKGEGREEMAWGGIQIKGNGMRRQGTKEPEINGSDRKLKKTQARKGNRAIGNEPRGNARMGKMGVGPGNCALSAPPVIGGN